MTWKFLLLIHVNAVNPPKIADGVGLSFPVLNVGSEFTDGDIDGFLSRGKFGISLRRMIRRESATIEDDSATINRLAQSILNTLPTAPIPSSFTQVPRYPQVTITLVDDAGDAEEAPIDRRARFQNATVAHEHDYRLCLEILEVQVQKLSAIASKFSSGAISFLEISSPPAPTAPSPATAAAMALQTLAVGPLVAQIKDPVREVEALSGLLNLAGDPISLQVMRTMQLGMMLKTMPQKSKLAQRLAGSLYVKLTGLPSVSLAPHLLTGGYGNVTIVLPRPSRVYAGDEMS